MRPRLAARASSSTHYGLLSSEVFFVVIFAGFFAVFFAVFFAETVAVLSDVSSDGANLSRLGALLAFGRFVLHRLPILKIAEPLTLDVGEMNEKILSSVIRCDESISLLLAEPLNRSTRQDSTPWNCQTPRHRPSGNEVLLILPTRRKRVAGFLGRRHAPHE